LLDNHADNFHFRNINRRVLYSALEVGPAPSSVMEQKPDKVVA
jgi:hypothetical protein